ncbi:hypothetical protein PPERSA_08635 [Pseudocohnilembus persalinus]|uniref:Transmembrane protein n=1 Tax=Pseudocohnilembus persalinus TaxID=266149 RepID=A0A0V0R550_PSEPJ|nr:hypothetical protein PPERSA_08635 [Pseudocohnilembus persalinus]|eukprot:KRX09603.1 hypothetical protein PPERSA_08635 [Pseudocohnilembus persalinus]
MKTTRKILIFLIFCVLMQQASSYLQSQKSNQIFENWKKNQQLQDDVKNYNAGQDIFDLFFYDNENKFLKISGVTKNGRCTQITDDQFLQICKVAYEFSKKFLVEKISMYMQKYDNIHYSYQGVLLKNVNFSLQHISKIKTLEQFEINFTGNLVQPIDFAEFGELENLSSFTLKASYNQVDKQICQEAEKDFQDYGEQKGVKFQLKCQ